MIMTEVSVENVSGSALEVILRKYLIDHSSRKINYLYWNITDAKDMTLSFVNLTGKELNRVNNSDLVYRIVRLKNADHWKIVSNFLNKYIIDPTDSRAVYVIRVDYLLTYLKGLKYDTSQIVLTRGPYGTVYCNDELPDKRKPICTVDTDIQSLYLIDRLYGKYRKMLYSDSPEWDIKDIMEEYLTDPKFKYVVDDLRVTLPVTEALDIVSRKFINERKDRETCKHEQIYMQNGLSTIASRFSCSDVSIVSVRVYIQIFLRKYSKQRK
jgi:hypothetical protein